MDTDLCCTTSPRTYFEGAAQGNELSSAGLFARYRPDRKSVKIALVVERDPPPPGDGAWATVIHRTQQT